MLVPWSVLRPSLQARRVRQVGYAIAGVSSAMLLGAAFAVEPFDSSRLVVAIFVMIFCAFAARPASRRRPLEIAVALDGEIKLRERRSSGGAGFAEGEPAESMPVTVSFAAPWLISLRSGTMLVSIWPDCLAPSVYRQLWVHLHWGRAAPRDDDRKTRMPSDKFTAR